MMTTSNTTTLKTDTSTTSSETDTTTAAATSKTDTTPSKTDTTTLKTDTTASKTDTTTRNSNIGKRRTAESSTRQTEMTSLSCYVRLFIVTSLTNVVTCSMREMMMFQMICSDDFSHVGSLSTDCNKFQMCSQGYAIALSCPPGYIFNDAIMRCHLPSKAEKAVCSKKLLSNMPFTCLHSPQARVASYLSCAQYFDCNARPSAPYQYVNYVTECPYPQLFSPETGRCEPFQRVRCVGRTEPKAPCDYLQYQQLCEGPRCAPCAKRHPSCVGLPDGPHALGTRSRVYIVCLAERTVNIGRCRQDYLFNDDSKRCVPRVPLPVPVSPLSANQISSFLSALTSNSTFMDAIKHMKDDQDSSSNTKNISPV